MKTSENEIKWREPPSTRRYIESVDPENSKLFLFGCFAFFLIIFTLVSVDIEGRFWEGSEPSKLVEIILTVLFLSSVFTGSIWGYPYLPKVITLRETSLSVAEAPLGSDWYKYKKIKKITIASKRDFRSSYLLFEIHTHTEEKRMYGITAEAPIEEIRSFLISKNVHVEII